ncbi:MAG: UDP-N-acetylmuramate--L-alanine ligase, partial [Putridiphycobacter sp.]|nr:UDP-N-acetylmuramate--L-alanine ligase [Putridiphycobacter sp.]
MNFSQIHTVYFIGVGGIGMSALARFFKINGKEVIGYDKTKTKLTELLISEGIDIHFEDKGKLATHGLDKANTIVIYTPAIPSGFGELQAFINSDFKVIKRSTALGIISQSQTTFAVAGTHGKTTTSSIMAHVLYTTEASCNAFIGGITTNYNSNCLISEKADRVVVEADEFDRSFLTLKPNYTIITSTDADHLDIYGSAESLKDSFAEFAELTNPNGILMVQIDSKLKQYNGKAKLLTYGLDSYDSDWFARNIRYERGRIYFDIHSKSKRFIGIEFGLPGNHNVENALAVFALLYEYGIPESHLREAFKSYLGVKRRFEIHLQNDDQVIIDDYAHHPNELTALLNSVKSIYPNKKITCVFQPHLFSRTRDFMVEFAAALSLSDKLYLLDIYPARELPIEGVTSSVLLAKVDITDKYLSSKSTIVADLKASKNNLIVIAGAGDIDTCIVPIVNAYKTHD